jgi:hypothetical protein
MFLLKKTIVVEKATIINISHRETPVMFILENENSRTRKRRCESKSINQENNFVFDSSIEI